MCKNYNWSNYTILVTEDDPLNFKYIELLLTKKTQTNIIWAKNGTESIQYAQKDMSINLVLLDLHLPDIEGLQVLQITKKHRPELPVFIQTANTWNDENRICIEAGADDFFTKPIHMDNLLAAMNIKLEEQIISTI